MVDPAPPASRRLLLVHAHPDDETIGTGATMAKYAAAGASVTLVTCTRGEEGEVVVEDLAHLAPDRDDRLGEHRIGELTDACAALGVADSRYLGGPGRWRDSGMMGTPSNDRPDCFWRADLDEATRLLVAIVREVRPQVVVTYDDNGGYGHPDHIQAHRVTVAAVERAREAAYAPETGPAWSVDKLYYTAFPKSVLQAGIDALAGLGGDSPFGTVTSADELPFGDPDEIVTTAVDARAFLDAKMAAMRAHRTQIRVDDGFFALADGVGHEAFGIEYYRLVHGQLGASRGDDGRENDLFAGIA